jgi:sugar phosphate permease
LIAIATLGGIIALASQVTRADLDRDRHSGKPLSLRSAFAPLKVVVKSAILMELSIVGLIYAATQVCLVSFLVVYLTDVLRMSLVTAGIALTVANIGGIVGRIGFGAVADRLLPPRTTLGVIGLIAGMCAYATAAFTTAWPLVALFVVCAAFGMTAIGWNGVQLAEIARHAPAGQAGPVTGATGFVTFGGVVLGPPSFALLASLTGSYRIGFAVFGSLSFVVACRLLLTRRPGNTIRHSIPP